MHASPPARRVLLASLLCLLSSCGTLRMYEGPQRPRSEVARIGEESGAFGFLVSNYSSATILEVDGVSVADHSESTIEVLPGPHVLRVEGYVGVPIGGDRNPKGTLAFDAAAGGEYEVRIGYGGTYTPPYVLLVDSATQQALADTRPTLEQLCTADVALDGRTWVMATWTREGGGPAVMLVPSGQSVVSWQESLGQHARPTGDAAQPALDREVELMRQEGAAYSPPYTVTSAPSEPSLRVVESHGLDREGGPALFTLTCIRYADGRIHRLSYAARSEATFRASKDRWLAAFKTAPLSWPEG